MLNLLLKIIEICFLAVFKKLFEKFELSSKVTRILIKIIKVILLLCSILVGSILVFFYMNNYQSIPYITAETEIARRMDNMISQCSIGMEALTPNFMTWSRIQKENGVYKLAFKEVRGDINGDGMVTDILRMRLNASVYNQIQQIDDATVKLFKTLPEFTPIGFLTGDVESIKKKGKMNIIIPIGISNDIERKLNIKTYEYNEDFKSFEYNPIFFTRGIIPNLGLKEKTGYQDTKLEVIWMVITKNNQDIIYGFSWSFTDENKCRFPNGSIAKTQALIEIAEYAKYNAKDSIIKKFID
jgi:hypothetical protein